MMHHYPPPSYEMSNQPLQVECVNVEDGYSTPPVDEIQNNLRPRDKSNKIKEAVLICLREFFGTAVYTYIGCLGTDVLSQGFVYSILQASTELSSVGGLHLNPVLTIAAAITGKMKPLILVIPMIISQFIGCLLGAGLCRGSQTKGSFLEHRDYFTTYHKISEVDKEEIWHYLLTETVMTCILTTVFLRLLPCTAALVPANKKEAESLEKQKYIHALFVGLAIVTLSFAGFRIKSGLMNPFRAFGPMAVYVAEESSKVDATGLSGWYGGENLWKGHWVYWAGPTAGAVIVAVAERIQGYIP